MNPYLRDGIDVYIEDTPDKGLCTIIFVFLSTRKRIQINAKKDFLKVLPLLDGDRKIEEVSSIVELPQQEVAKFVDYLESRNIVTSKNWYLELNFDDSYKCLIEKQLYFLMDMLHSSTDVYEIQKRIRSTRIGIFGLGSIGSWILVELLQMGFELFALFDFKPLAKDSVSRHAFFSEDCVGEFKGDYYKDLAKHVNPNAEVVAKKISISIDSNFTKELSSLDFLINCADEPYVGYTSIALSRFCVAHGKVLFVAGGFDAHLGCFGEMIVPQKTPCSDCYSQYFKASLKDWKPVNHPVKNRAKGFGGLAPLSVFSASTAALSILRYFLNETQFLEAAGGRGEFKFDDYTIDAFEVRRDSNCEVCGDRK
ncbi:MAG: ThiF family adenylyltransferase [Syntrophotaleaceae bacterium]